MQCYPRSNSRCGTYGCRDNDQPALLKYMQDNNVWPAVMVCDSHSFRSFTAMRDTQFVPNGRQYYDATCYRCSWEIINAG